MRLHIVPSYTSKVPWECIGQLQTLVVTLRKSLHLRIAFSKNKIPVWIHTYRYESCKKLLGIYEYICLLFNIFENKCSCKMKLSGSFSNIVYSGVLISSVFFQEYITFLYLYLTCLTSQDNVSQCIQKYIKVIGQIKQSKYFY